MAPTTTNLEAPTSTFSLHETRALQAALQHAPSCICSNCTTAIHAVVRELKPYQAVCSPRDEDVLRAVAEIHRSEVQLAEAHRKLALLGVAS